MIEPKTLKELVDDFANSVSEAGLAWATNDQGSLKKAKSAMQKTHRAIKKKDKEYNSLAELMETSKDDFVRAVTAHWILQAHEEKSLRVLDVIAKKDNVAGRYALKVANEWRERKKILERRYKNYKLILSLIIIVGIINVFSIVYREISYAEAINYSRILRYIVFVFAGTLYLFSQKDNFGYYFSIFYFCAGLLHSFLYFYLRLPQGLSHDIIYDSSEFLMGCFSLAALFVLFKDGAVDMKKYWRDRGTEINKLFQFKFYSKRP